MEIIIQLIITSIDWRSSQYYVFSADLEEITIPSMPLECCNPEEKAKDIFSKHIDLDPNWAKMTITSAERYEQEEDLTKLVITYATVVPYDAIVKEGRFVTLDEFTIDSHVNRAKVNQAIGLI